MATSELPHIWNNQGVRTEQGSASLLVSCVDIITGREWLIRSHSSARFYFKLSGYSNKSMPYNMNFHQNFELEISLN